MSKTTDKEDEILEEAISYVVAVSRGQNYKYPKGWDKNMKRAVRRSRSERHGHCIQEERQGRSSNFTE